MMITPRIDIETVVWGNLQADVYLGLHANAVRLYLTSVVTPAMDAIATRHEELSRCKEPAAVFQMSNVEELRRSSIEAFALAIQSLWERQLRVPEGLCTRVEA